MNGPSHAARPRVLTAGSRVALVAPAGPLDAPRIAASEARCRELGLEPVVFPAAAKRERYMAGTDDERLADLQAAFDDRSVDAVWALRGGYGTLRILDRLSLARQQKDPIAFVGFSDNTTLHVRHAEMGVVSFHGPHPAGERSADADAWLERLLFRPEPAGPLPRPAEGPEPRPVVEGVAEGPLYGGNLAILASMCGAAHAPRAGGRILFLEDVGEPPYRVDRMLCQLERAGALDGVLGLAYGRFTGEGREAAEGVSQVIAEYAERLAVPAVADLPFGHVPCNLALPVGVRARLDAKDATLTLTEPATRAG